MKAELITAPFQLIFIRLTESQVLYPVLIHKRTGTPDPMVAEWARALLETGSQATSYDNQPRKRKSRYRRGTVDTFLREIVFFLTWANSRKVDLLTRFSGLSFLRKAEVRDFASFLNRARKSGYRKQVKLRPAPATINKRLVAAKSFCLYHANHYLERTTNPDLFSMAEKRLRLLERHFTGMLYPRAIVEAETTPHEALSDAAAQLLLDIAHPVSELNPFRAYSTRVRNYCLLWWSLESGPRRSEPALLEIQDVHTQLPTVCIKYPSAKIRNARRDGANLKTKARDVGISDDLHKALGFYIQGPRDDLLNGRTSNALFPSTRDGKRLTTSAINNIFQTLHRKVPQLRELTARCFPHMLRKRLASNVRDAIDEGLPSTSPLVRAGAIQDMMTYQFGWNNRSNMPRHYAQASLMRRVHEATRKLNKAALKGLHDEK